MDYAPIALQATDVLVDKHFHKIPNAAFRTETYKPFKASRRRRREERERRDSEDQGQNPDQSRGHLRDRGEYGQGEGQRRQEDPYNDPEIEEAGYDSEPDYTSRQKERNMRDRDWDWDSRERDGDLRDIPRHSGAGTEAGYGYGYGYPYEESHGSHSPPQLPYSQQPPRVRPEYLPKHRAAPEPRPASQHPHPFSAGPMAPFPDARTEGARARAGTRRPPYTQRRSSYDDIHEARNSRPGSTERRLAPREPRRGARSDHGSSAGGGMRDRADRYGLKDEVRGLFTDSPRGLAGGALGALVGGWATEKLQEAQTGRDRRAMGDRAKVYTLLGAAAGGLVANAVVDKWQGGREEARQRRAEEKYPDGTEDARCEREERKRDRERERDRSRDRNTSCDERARRSDGVAGGYY